MISMHDFYETYSDGKCFVVLAILQVKKKRRDEVRTNVFTKHFHMFSNPLNWWNVKCNHSINDLITLIETLNLDYWLITYIQTTVLTSVTCNSLKAGDKIYDLHDTMNHNSVS